MLRFIVSLILLLGTITAAMVLDAGNPIALIRIPALFIELLVPVFAMLAVWRLAEVGHAFRDAFSRKGDAASRSRSARIWELTEKVCYAAAVIGPILGAVLILSSGRNSAAELSAAVSSALIAPLYGITLGIVCRILKARVEL
jgi:flagellar motor component MotA